MIIENGLCVTNADSYVDLEFANNYFSTRQVTSWEDLEDSDKEVYLIKATDYVDNAFEWKGIKKTQNQSLKFPRSNLFDNDGYEVTTIPTCLQNAICECVIILLQGKETFKTENANGKVTSERIGELSFSYAQGNDNSETLYETLNLRLRGLYKDKSKKVIYSGKVERV